jgi:hypothetical protein
MIYKSFNKKNNQNKLNGWEHKSPDITKKNRLNPLALYVS